MSVRANAELFRQILLFADCEDTHLQLLSFTSERMAYRPGVTIVRAGDQGQAGYLIVFGTADVWITEGKTNRTVATVGPGAFIGELAMIAGAAYPANVTATSEMTAIRVSRDVFMRVATEFPDFGLRVHRKLAERLDLSLDELNQVRRLFEEAQSFSRRKIERG
jgi:CRP/FNR family cyclic AMP-dependent transcriptional regulator